MEKNKNEEIIELIKNIDKYTLDEYCLESLKYLEKQEKIEYFDLIIEDALDNNNTNVRDILLKIDNLIDQNILPKLEGLIGLDSILDYEEYGSYIEPFIENDKVEVYDPIKGYIVKVSGSSVKLISGIQESEVIVTTTELKGFYYVLYHDGGVETLLATSDDDFIKSMIALSLLRINKQIFKTILKYLKNNDSDYKNKRAERTLSIIIFDFDYIVDSINNSDDELIDYYYEIKDN